MTLLPGYGKITYGIIIRLIKSAAGLFKVAFLYKNIVYYHKSR